MKVWLSGAVALSIFGAGSAPPGSVLAVQELLLEPTTASNSLAGASIAIDGDRALVGAPGLAGGGGPGVVYAYERVAGVWALTQTILNPGGAEPDNFGASVALAGDHAVIGAPFSGSSEEGAAYHFEHTGTWTGTPLARPAGAPTRFGASVAISLDWIVVGAPDSGTAAPGAAFVYPIAGGAPASLTAPDAEAEDRFGASVAVSGAAILVGAPDDDNARGTDAGSVHAFDLAATWDRSVTLVPDANGAVRFGTSVALSENGARALAGAPGETVASLDGSGAAYAFERTPGSAWPATGARLVATDARASDRFGTSVALSGTDAAIGAPFHEDAASLDSGMAYLFSLRAEWEEVARYRRDGAEAEDGLGSSVAVSGRTVLAGASQSGTTARVGFAASFVFPDPTGAACTRDDRCESGECEMNVCCEGCESCQRCGAAGMCEALPDATECASPCGTGSCQSGVCSTECPDTGPAIDGSLPPRAHVSGCKCGASGARGGVYGIALFAIAIALRIARRRRGPRRRTARTRTP